MNKKIYASVIAGAVALLVSPLAAFAIRYTPPEATSLVSITADGTAAIRGKVTGLPALATDKLQVTSWGKVFDIDFSKLLFGKILLDNKNKGFGDTVFNILSDADKFKIGDTVGLSGKANSSGVITTDYVHNWTIDKTPTLDTVIIEGTLTSWTPLTLLDSVPPTSVSITGKIVVIGDRKITDSVDGNYVISIVSNCAVVGCIPVTYLNDERVSKPLSYLLWTSGDLIRVQAKVMTGEKTGTAMAIRNTNITGNARK